MELHLVVTEKKARTLTYEIRFRRLEPGPAEEVAVGKLVVVCVQKDAERNHARRRASCRLGGPNSGRCRRNCWQQRPDSVSLSGPRPCPGR